MGDDGKRDAVREAVSGLSQELPTERLIEEGKNLLRAVAERALTAATERASETAERLTDYAENGGSAGLKAVLSGARSVAEGKSPAAAATGGVMTGLKETVKDQITGKAKKAVGLGGGGGGGGGAGKNLKVTNIVEQIDVGVPRRVAYNQWTMFQDFPSFMKKVESVDQTSDETLNWKAQIFLSHRTWESTIKEQVPDERIVWRSTGAKGYVDGTVTFHEITPDLTRILLVLEYHPQGFFEGTGNLWRAQGRRVRLELKHFRRHVMTQTILNPDEVEGWRGEIRDSEVVKTHEDALKEESEQTEESERAESAGGEAETEQRAGEEGAEGEEEYSEEEPEEEPEEEEESTDYEERGEDDEYRDYRDEGDEYGAYPEEYERDRSEARR